MIVVFTFWQVGDGPAVDGWGFHGAFAWEFALHAMQKCSQFKVVFQYRQFTDAVKLRQFAPSRYSTAWRTFQSQQSRYCTTAICSEVIWSNYAYLLKQSWDILLSNNKSGNISIVVLIQKSRGLFARLSMDIRMMMNAFCCIRNKRWLFRTTDQPERVRTKNAKLGLLNKVKISRKCTDSY